MRGVITEKEVISNLGLIVSEFGIGTLLRCLVAVVKRERTTFLDIACKGVPH